MKLFLTFLLVLSSIYAGISQDTLRIEDETEISEGSIRIIAKVINADYDYMTILVEEVIGWGRGVSSAPSKGEELTVRLPGRDKPNNETRIEVDLKEKIDIGAMPTSFIVIEYRTID